MNRSQFESEFPVPENMVFDDEKQYYVCTDAVTRLTPEIVHYNTRWETWQRYAGRTPADDVLQATLRISQCGAPRSKWFWQILLQNGHCYTVSDTFEDQHEVIQDATVFGMAALQKALWIQDTTHLFTPTACQDE